MFSTHRIDDKPKYIWSVDDNDVVYEAKIDGSSDGYHGYVLDDDMKAEILREWKRR